MGMPRPVEAAVTFEARARIGTRPLKRAALLAWLAARLALLSGAFAADKPDQADFDAQCATNFSTAGFVFDIAGGPFKPNARSFGENYTCPDWFRDAKFGIYMHWGLGSVPGFNGHYARYMYHQQEPEAARQDRLTGRKALSGYRPGQGVYDYHVKTYGHPSKFGYKDFIPMWKADKFDAAALAALYKESGAKYVGVMAVHHDNFDLYDSTHQPWNSCRMGPGIDIVGAWQKACAKENLRFAITSHLSNQGHEHLFYQGETDATGPLAGVPYDTVDPRNEGLYGRRTPDRLKRLNPAFAQSWYLRTKELIDKYNPDLVYLDGGLPNGDYGLNLAAHFYNRYLKVNGKQEGVFTIKRRTPSGFTLDVESAGIEKALAEPWQVDTTINPGWFYLGRDAAASEGADDAGMSAAEDSKSGPDRIRLPAGKVIDNLVDIVSKNGNMLLNVGLRPDGSLPETFRRELEEIGRWLKVNGEAIYGTRPFKVFGEGPFRMPKSESKFNDNEYAYTAQDIRFTTKGATVYAILLDWPGDGTRVRIKSLGSKSLGPIQSVALLATGEPLKWAQGDDGLLVNLPGKAVGEHAYVLKITEIP